MLYGDITAIALGSGIGYCFGVAVAQGVSGGHLNPIVSVALGAWRIIDFWSVTFYLSGQYVGSFLGIVLAYSLQSKTIQELDIRKPYKSAMIFGPTPNFSIYGTFILIWKEFLGAACLTVAFFVAHDKHNTISSKNAGMVPIFLGLVMAGLQYITCLLTFSEFNPASDIMGRMFYTISGFGVDVFKDGQFYFWIPLLIPYVGGLFGSLIYRTAIAWHWPDVKKQSKKTLPPPIIKEEKIIHPSKRQICSIHV